MSRGFPVMPSDARDDAAQLDHDEWPLRWQRKLGLAPEDGMGLVRRAAFFAMVAWLPLAVWAFLQGRALPGGIAEPLLTHFGINVRCLVAIPLLILAEGAALRTTVATAGQFVRNGLVTEAQRARLPRTCAMWRACATRRCRGSSCWD